MYCSAPEPTPAPEAPPHPPEPAPDDAATPLARRLADTRLFRDYRDAFRKATGLPLTLRPLRAYDRAPVDPADGNPFCVLLARSNKGCADCLRLQARLEREARLEPKTLHCFAGLCDSAVPVRVGGGLVAFLQTGQILLHRPDRREFTRITRQLLRWGAQVNLRELEEAYFQTQVFDRAQYEAMLRLLATFAEHLAAISHGIDAGQAGACAEPPLVGDAKTYIGQHYAGRISLDEAASAVNASTRHFCKVFKEATGMTFTDYLARVRVEKAKHLLRNPHKRVGEIAFATGFDSISQFNRSFKRVTGRTPTRFRRESG